MENTDRIEGEKKLYYISAEFLTGRLILNNLLNLGVLEEMKTLQAHTLMEAMEGKPYFCNFALGAKVDGVVDAVERSLESKTWEKC